MNSVAINSIEADRQRLLGQLDEAKASLRAALHSHGFDNTARAHLERAVAHIAEAYIGINENHSVRSVDQLVSTLNRFEQVMDTIKQRRSQHI